MSRICVFCGSADGARPHYREFARELGAGLAKRGHAVVYGGASVGTMGALADGALDAGGEVIGVIPQTLVAREVAHRGLSELIVVDSMHARKARMTALSDHFAVLPGGFGTLDELFEALTWSQLGIHDHPVHLLNLNGFWDPLLATLDHMVDEGFLRPNNRDLLHVRSSIGAFFDVLEG